MKLIEVMRKLFELISLAIVMTTMLFILMNIIYWLVTGYILMDVFSSHNFKR